MYRVSYPLMSFLIYYNSDKVHYLQYFSTHTAGGHLPHRRTRETSLTVILFDPNVDKPFSGKIEVSAAQSTSLLDISNKHQLEKADVNRCDVMIGAHHLEDHTHYLVHTQIY